MAESGNKAATVTSTLVEQGLCFDDETLKGKNHYYGCQGGNDTSTKLLHCEKASACTRRVSANCHNAN